MKNTLKTLMIMGTLLQGGAVMANNSQVNFTSQTAKAYPNTYTVALTGGEGTCSQAGDQNVACNVKDIRNFTATVTRTSDNTTCNYIGKSGPELELQGACDFALGIDNKAGPNIVTVSIK